MDLEKFKTDVDSTIDLDEKFIQAKRLYEEKKNEIKSMEIIKIKKDFKDYFYSDFQIEDIAGSIKVSYRNFTILLTTRDSKELIVDMQIQVNEKQEYTLSTCIIPDKSTKDKKEHCFTTLPPHKTEEEKKQKELAFYEKYINGYVPTYKYCLSKIDTIKNTPQKPDCFQTIKEVLDTIIIRSA
jgi:hypothetical protein